MLWCNGELKYKIIINDKNIYIFYSPLDYTTLIYNIKNYKNIKVIKLILDCIQDHQFLLKLKKIIIFLLVVK